MKVAAIALVLGACAGPTVSGTVGGQPFDAADGFFDLGTHENVFQNSSVTFTELRFVDFDGACARWASAGYPLPSHEVAAALDANGVTPAAGTHLDSTVTEPGMFSLGAANGAVASAIWILYTASHGQEAPFDAGTITITEVSSDRIDGAIDVTAADGSHVAGDFHVGHCAAADWVH
jgi:hypothetical protein